MPHMPLWVWAAPLPGAFMEAWFLAASLGQGPLAVNWHEDNTLFQGDPLTIAMSRHGNNQQWLSVGNNNSVSMDLKDLGELMAAHLAVVTLLDALAAQPGVEVRVNDDSGFWDTRDKAQLKAFLEKESAEKR